MLVAFVFISAPASALTYTKYPPYGGGIINPVTIDGYIGNYEVYRHDLSANPTDGSIQFHLGADTGPPSGAVWVDAKAGLSGGVAFTPSVAGSYVIDYYFHIVSGNAQGQTFPLPFPPGAANIQMVLQFGGNLYSQSGWWALHSDQMTTVWSGYFLSPWSWLQDLSGRQFKVEFTTPTVTVGQNYYIYAYESGYIQLNWPTSGLYALGLFDMNSKLDTVTAYIYTGGGGGGGCVQKDTPILTPSGYVEVQRLKKGDTILSYDLGTGNLVPTTLTSITSSKVGNIVDVNNGSLRLTPYDQPIYIQNSTYTGWLRNPGELVAGDYVFNAVTGNWILVTLIQGMSGTFTVYGLTTTVPNNYVANGFLLDYK